MPADDSLLDASAPSRTSAPRRRDRCRCWRLPHAPAKFAERHQQHPIVVFLLLQILPECAKSIGQLLHQRIMPVQLLGMRVESAEARRNKRASAIRRRSSPRWSSGRCRIRWPDTASASMVPRQAQNFLAAQLRVHRRAMQEIQLVDRLVIYFGAATRRRSGRSACD